MALLNCCVTGSLMTIVLLAQPNWLFLHLPLQETGAMAWHASTPTMVVAIIVSGIPWSSWWIRTAKPPPNPSPSFSPPPRCPPLSGEAPVRNRRRRLHRFPGHGASQAPRGCPVGAPSSSSSTARRSSNFLAPQRHHRSLLPPRTPVDAIVDSPSLVLPRAH